MAASTLSIPTSSSIYTTVNSLVTVLRQPITTLQTKRATVANLDNIYTDVRTSLKALQTGAGDLSQASAALSSARTAVSSDTGILSVSATSGAEIGVNSIAVTQLAHRHTLVTHQFSQDGSALRSALGSGTQSFNITINGVTTSVSVQIGEDDTDVEIVSATATAINDALKNATHGATAGALNDSSSTVRLTLTSNDTGLANKITLADTEGSLLSSLGLLGGAAATDTTGGYIYADSELDAKLKVNGIAMTRSSNVVTDAIPGLTLTLNGVQSSSATPVKVTVSSDTSTLRSKAASFLSNLNSTVTYLGAKTAIDRATGTRQALASQSSYRGLYTELKSLGAVGVDTGVASIRCLSDIGITRTDAGVYSISDESKFAEMSAGHADAVAKLLGGDNGISTVVTARLTPFLAGNGILDNDSDGVDARLKAIDDSIKRLEASVAIKQEQLVTQYAHLQEVTKLMENQSNFLDLILGSTSSS